MSRVGSSQVPSRSKRSLSQVPGESRSTPKWVPGESRSSLKQVLGMFGRVPGKSRRGLEWVLAESRSSPRQVPVGSRVGFGKVHQFENEMFKVEKWFTIFKTVNIFQKLKKNFWSKKKYFLLTIILRRTKHYKMQKLFSKNYFTSKEIVFKHDKIDIKIESISTIKHVNINIGN